jgi:hypothetical protein
MADGLVPVPPLALPPDSPMILKSSRHPITEAGFDHIVENMEKALSGGAAGDPERGRITYDGLEQPPALSRSCHKLVRVTPTGETWLVYVDPQTWLPALVQANGPDGELIERYVFRDPLFDPTELAAADAFNPNQRWGGKTQGWLQRIARAKGGDSAKPADSTVSQ